MESATASVVWSDGRLLDDGEVPDQVEIELGLLLGMSPVVHVAHGVLADEHAAVLHDAATVLGYDGPSIGQVADRVRGLGTSRAALAVVPTADHHRAMPAGSAWRLVEVDAPDDRAAAPVDPEPVDVVTSPFARRALPEVASIVLCDDAEQAAAALRQPGGPVDVGALLRRDGDGHVARVGDAAVFARVDGRVVTARLADGAPRTAWRAVLLDGVHETSLTVDALHGAISLALLDPDGSVRTVRSVDGVVIDDAELAVELRSRLDAVVAAGGAGER